MVKRKRSTYFLYGCEADWPSSTQTSPRRPERQCASMRNSIVYKGSSDLTVIPTVCMGHSILRQMRVVLEIKHTQAQKDARNAGDLPVG